MKKSCVYCGSIHTVKSKKGIRFYCSKECHDKDLELHRKEAIEGAIKKPT